MNKLLIALAATSFTMTAFAQETKIWDHESEASIVNVGGNTTSESYSAKQQTSYKMDSNVFVGKGRYLQTKAGGQETARQWDASLRYEREFSAHWAAFIQHGAESDPYAGYLQRDNTDIGGKYYFIKSDTDNFFAELGLRTTKTMSSAVNETTYSNSGRLYTEYAKKLNESVSGKLWVEYLPDLKENDNYFINYEPSLSVMMTQILSIKISYLVKYHNLTTAPGEKKEDTSLTTSLVAKF